MKRFHEGQIKAEQMKIQSVIKKEVEMLEQFLKYWDKTKHKFNKFSYYRKTQIKNNSFYLWKIAYRRRNER